MSTLYVTEFIDLKLDSNNKPILVGREPPVVEQTVSFTATHGESAAFHPETTFIRVHTDGICSVAVGSSPVAVTTNRRMVAGQTEFLGVLGGQKISAVTNT
jgi:hypothetical protein